MFSNRNQAGRQLATLLGEYAHADQTQLLALPRGGVGVAYEVALALHLPLDVLLVRKLGLPGHEELAMGAIAVGDACYLNHQLIASANVTASQLQQVKTVESAELLRRNALYRQGKDDYDVADKTVILIDDGIATGATVEVALQALQAMQVHSIVVAVPVAPKDVVNRLSSQVDVVCVATPEPFFAIGQHYADFGQVTDQEVLDCLLSK